MERLEHIHVGVLALQGDYELHEHQLDILGVRQRRVKLPSDLNGLDALIMPGGESTTIGVLIDRFALRQPLVDFGRTRPVYGTCAGMILLSKHIEDNLASVKPLQLIDIDVVRTGYGRQICSFEETLEIHLDSNVKQIRASFIRAPRVTRVGESVETLSVYNGLAVLAAQNNILAASFHTELEGNTTLLSYFLRRFVGVQVAGSV